MDHCEKVSSSMENEGSSNKTHESSNTPNSSSTMENNNDRCKLPPRPTGDAPWLVYTHGNSKSKKKRKKIQTICALFGSNNSNNSSVVYRKSIPALRGKKIYASCHGWLVLGDLDNSKTFSLFNIVTLQSLNLPPLPHCDVLDEAMPRLSACVLTSPLLNSDSDADHTSAANCVLALFFEDRVFWCRPTLSHSASIKWVFQRFNLNDNRIKLHQSTVVNGIIYSWANVYEVSEGCYFKYLVSLKADDEDLSLLTLTSLNIGVPDCGYPCIHATDYLVESCGLLYCVEISIRRGGDDEISVIKVWEPDLVARKWVEVKCLGDRAFFLGEDFNTWCWGSNHDPITESSSSSLGGVQGNCVYFIRDDDEILYSYNLAEGCVTPFQTCTNLQTPVAGVNWLNVMPQHHRLPVAQYRKEHNRKIYMHQHSKEENIGYGFDETQERVDLPNDLIQVVAECLHLFEYWNFRACCKTYQSLLSPLPQKKTDNLLPSPLFIFFKNDDDGLCQMMDPSRDACSYWCNHLQLTSDRFTVDFSKNGWIIIHNHFLQALKFLNPFTRERRDFVGADDLLIYDLRSIGFSTTPTSPGCVTVIFDSGIDDSVLIHYIQYGDSAWKDCEFHDDEEPKFWAGRSSPVFFAGAFYVFDVNGRLGEFRLLANGKENWRVYREPDIEDNILYSYHLVECGGDLLGVCIGDMGSWVAVFKFNHSEEKWSKVETLGDYSLFISNPSSFSAQATDARMRNRIYMPRLRGSNLIFYSIDTGKFYVSGREDDSLENYLGTSEPLHCFWF